MMPDLPNNNIENLVDVQRRLDLLADGELDDLQRRELLLWLEEHPAQWRRCALAFVEGQQWGQDLKRLSREKETPPRLISPAPRVCTPAAKSSSPGVYWFSLAAAILLSFTIGLVLQRAWLETREHGGLWGEPLAGSTPPARAPELAGRLPGPVVPEVVPGGAPAFAPTGPRFPGNGGGGDSVTLAVDEENSGQPRTINVPLVKAEQLGLKLPEGEEMEVIPPEVVRRLEQMGHRILRERRFAPVSLKDGRTVLVPVDDVTIIPANQSMY